MKKSSALLLVAALLAGCMTLARHNLDQAYGPEQPDRFDHALPGQGPISYRRDIQPILDNRCVVCHACYDGPCQLKLSAWDGVARGASKAQVYDGTRLLEAPLTRLFIDAERPSEWRQKDFHPVLNERSGNPAAELDASPLARMLRLKAPTPCRKTRCYRIPSISPWTESNSARASRNSTASRPTTPCGACPSAYPA